MPGMNSLSWILSFLEMSIIQFEHLIHRLHFHNHLYFYCRDVRLFYTARNMIELYRVVVPTYYEEDLVMLTTNFALDIFVSPKN